MDILMYTSMNTLNDLARAVKQNFFALMIGKPRSTKDDLRAKLAGHSCARIKKNRLCGHRFKPDDCKACFCLCQGSKGVMIDGSSAHDKIHEFVGYDDDFPDGLPASPFLELGKCPGHILQS